jgi:multidrug efflux pump subunit AcrA (membrane-fusion protein)
MIRLPAARSLLERARGSVLERIDRSLAIQWGCWIAATIAFAVLFVRHQETSGYWGVARGRVARLSVSEPARVEAIHVQPFQHVREGEVLAVLADDVPVARIAATQAEIARLRAEFAENRGLTEADVEERLARWEAASRAFDDDMTQIGIELQQARAELQYDRALVEGLREQSESLERTFRDGHAAGSEVAMARAEFEATARRVEENERLVARLEDDQAAIEARRKAYRRSRPMPLPEESALGHLSQAVAVQEALAREYEALRDELVIRAPFDGLIVDIQSSAGEAALQRPGEGAIRQPGEVVAPGEPVVVVADGRPSEIVAYDDTGDDELRPGAEVDVLTFGRPQMKAVSRVTAVGATVERLPERLWRVAGQAEWGRPFVIPIPPGFEVDAGERVLVRIR